MATQHPVWSASLREQPFPDLFCPQVVWKQNACSGRVSAIQVFKGLLLGSAIQCVLPLHGFQLQQILHNVLVGCHELVQVSQFSDHVLHEAPQGTAKMMQWKTTEGIGFTSEYSECFSVQQRVTYLHVMCQLSSSGVDEWPGWFHVDPVQVLEVRLLDVVIYGLVVQHPDDLFHR